MNNEELAKLYADKNVAKKGQYIDCDFDVRKELTVFDGYDIEQAYEDGFNKAVELTCAFLKDRIEHDSIDYPMATMYLIEDFKQYIYGNNKS